MIEVFCFGSNLAGIHGAGSAFAAYKKHGALWGNGVGLMGNSYAIPTKDHAINSMTISEIKPYVDEFLEFARNNPDMRFNVVAIGCGLAGFKPYQIAPMFRNYSHNCVLPQEFLDVLNGGLV